MPRLSESSLGTRVILSVLAVSDMSLFLLKDIRKQNPAYAWRRYNYCIFPELHFYIFKGYVQVHNFYQDIPCILLYTILSQAISGLIYANQNVYDSKLETLDHLIC